MLIENVPQFLSWTLFPHWRSALETLGYAIQELIVDAADFGTPQNRKRLFIAGRLGSSPGLTAPEPASQFVTSREGWTPAEAILDPNAGKWDPVSRKSENVRARVERGRANHGDLFLTQHVTNHPGRSLARPLPTVTTADQMALVRGDEIRPLSIEEYLKAQGFAADYFSGAALTRKEACRMVGNAVAVPVARALCEQIATA